MMGIPAGFEEPQGQGSRWSQLAKPWPQKPALSLKVEKSGSRGSTQPKRYQNLVTTQSLAAAAVPGRGAILGDMRGFRGRLPRKAN